MDKRELAKYGLVGAGLTGAVVTSQPVFAQTTTPIDDMSTEIAKVDGIADAVIPLAIATVVFGIGALIVKRFAYS